MPFSTSTGRIATPGLCVVAMIAMLVPAFVLAGPHGLIRDSIPQEYKWDLSDIYPDWDGWESDYALADSLIVLFQKYEGRLADGPTMLATVLEERDRIGMVADRVYLYSSLASSIDARDNDLAGRYQRYENLAARFSEASAWLDPELLTVSEATLTDWLAQESRLTPYTFEIKNLLRNQSHVLTAAQEKLLAYFGSFNSSPGSIYGDMVYSDIKYPDFVLESGDTLSLTESQVWLQMGTNPNQDERYRMFREFYGAYHGYVNTYASIYNSVLQRDYAMARARNYGTALEAALGVDNVPIGVLDNLVRTVRQGVEPLRRYHRVRKKALGLEHYYWSDRKIPVVSFEKTYDFKEVVPWIIEAVAPLGEEYQNRLSHLLSQRWIDVYENEGKYTGAFEDDAYGVHPYILMNFNGTLESVFTLAHEAGHAMHSIYAAENQPYATAYYTIFVAEVPSTLNEALLLEYLLNRSDDPAERITLLQQAIDNIAGTYCLQVLFADFEWQAHQLVENGEPVTADALRSIYGDLLNDYYGDAIEIDSLFYSYWTRIGHFFESPYYVYKYATCYASSASLVAEIRSDDQAVREDVLKRYFTLLKSGSNDYPMEQLKRAGVDLSTPDALQAVMVQLDRLVTRLETELDKL